MVCHALDKNDQLTNWTKITLKFIVLVQLLIFNWFISVLSQLFGSIVPRRSKASEIKKRLQSSSGSWRAMTKKWCHICHNLIINDLFKVPIYCLLWINGILLVQRISTCHRNLIGKSIITCLKNNKSCSTLWCLVPRPVANLVSVMYHTANYFRVIMNASCKNPLPPSHKTWSPFLKSPGYFLGPKSHLQLLVWTSRESFSISRICAHIKQPCNHNVWDFAMTSRVWKLFWNDQETSSGA